MAEDASQRFNAQVFTQVINLDRSTDRLETVSAYLKAAGLDYTRFAAIEGRKLDMNEPEMRRVVDVKKWMRRHHRNPTPADIGCYLSHYYAIQAFLAQDKPFGLIFEDDAAFGPDFIPFVTHALNDPNEWDILKLHARHPGPMVTRRDYGDGVKLCSFVARHAGTTCYIINRRAGERMLKHLIPAVRMIDWACDQGHLMNLRVRTLTPMIVGLQAVETTRDTGVSRKRSWIEKQTDRPILPRWQLPFRRVWDELHRVSYTLFADGGLAAMLFGPKR